MLPPEHPDGIQIAFDDHRLVANGAAAASQALRLGLSELADRYSTWVTLPNPATS